MRPRAGAMQGLFPVVIPQATREMIPSEAPNPYFPYTLDLRR